jgi:Domain of unknown function (DUF6542)
MLTGASASAPSDQPEQADETAEPAVADRRAPLIALAGRRPSAANSEPDPVPISSPARPHVTARGAIVAMFGLFLVSDLIAAWSGLEVIAGLGFVASCLLAPYLVRRHALLRVVAAPPAVFLAALLIEQVLTAQGTSRHGKVLSVFEGTLLTLAALAPWLLAGTALGAVAAIPRGIMECLSELRNDLREDLRERRPWAARTR